MTWVKTGNIRGPQGPQGPQGDPGVAGSAGAPGAQGAAGTGITFKGSVATTGDLPTEGNANGDAYLVAADDSLHIYDGAAFVDGGSIQGPPGPTGSAGVDGAAGPRGSLWHSVSGDPTTVLTTGNVAGDQTVDATTGDVYEWS